MDTSAILQNRIDFCGVIVAEMCNPNGDPINSNMPRQDFAGHGIITDVCLKRKIRDRLFENGHDIFIVRQDELPEGMKSLQDRAKSEEDMVTASKEKDDKQYKKVACEKWIDVRAFGQVFAFKETGGGVSVPIRGPVSIQEAVTLDVVDVIDYGITKAINTNNTTNHSGKASDTFGTRYMINHGAYVFRGSMYPMLAKQTGFTYGDAMAIKDAMIHMFMNDASAARPAGSIELHKLYWWEHSCPNGQYSPAKVFRSLELKASDEYPYYTATSNELIKLDVQIYEGW